MLAHDDADQRVRTIERGEVARIVKKFGGTSVGDVERIKHVAELIKADVDKGHEIVVVVSARWGVTN